MKFKKIVTIPLVLIGIVSFMINHVNAHGENPLPAKRVCFECSSKPSKMYIDKALVNACRGRCRLVRNPKNPDEFQLINNEYKFDDRGPHREVAIINGMVHIEPHIWGLGNVRLEDGTVICLDALGLLSKKWHELSTYQVEEYNEDMGRRPITYTKQGLTVASQIVAEILKDCISYEAFLDAVLGSDWVYPVNKVMNPV